MIVEPRANDEKGANADNNHRQSYTARHNFAVKRPGSGAINDAKSYAYPADGIDEHGACRSAQHKG